MTTTPAIARLVRDHLKDACELSHKARTRVVVVPGDSPPGVFGVRGYHTFRDGGTCHYPGSARRAGYKVVYHRSTYRIEVGEVWVARALYFGDDTPAGVVDDWLAEEKEKEVPLWSAATATAG